MSVLCTWPAMSRPLIDAIVCFSSECPMPELPVDDVVIDLLHRLNELHHECELQRVGIDVAPNIAADRWRWSRAAPRYDRTFDSLPPDGDDECTRGGAHCPVGHTSPTDDAH
jgi:hypothetical protein